MSYSTFQPFVNVDDDGTISTDWGDSYVSTWADDCVSQLDDTDVHSEMLDKRIADIREVIGRYDATSGCDGYSDVSHELVDLIRPFFERP